MLIPGKVGTGNENFVLDICSANCRFVNCCVNTIKEADMMVLSKSIV